MKISSEAEYSINDIQNMVSENNLNVMITGGECTYGNNLIATMTLLNEIEAREFEIETNGFNLLKLIEGVKKSNKNITYVLSPKLFLKEDFIFYTDLIIKIKDNEKVIIKLVTENRKEIIEFLDYLKEIKFDSNRLWLMPEGITKDELIKNSPFVFDMCEKYSANFSSRDHVIYNFT
jgi:organic radical activating enzyme